TSRDAQPAGRWREELRLVALQEQLVRWRQIQRAVSGRALQRLQPRAVQPAGDTRRLQRLWRGQQPGQRATSGATVSEADVLRIGESVAANGAAPPGAEA